MTVALHLAKNLDDLNYLAIQHVLHNNFRNTRPTILYKIARNIYNELSKYPNDDELTYIYAYRFLKLVEVIYAKDSDKQFVHMQFDVWREQANQILNKQREVLIARYTALGLCTSPTLKRKLSAADIDTTQQFNAFADAVDGFITAKQFYNGLQTCKDEILIMDVRSAQLFAESRLQGAFNIINIDDRGIEKGVSAYKFEEKLGNDVRDTFMRRNLFGYIILMDMDSTKDSFHTSKLKILYDMLTVWDINKKYKRLPFILNGGYMDFIDMYPSLSTNSNIICKQRYADLDDLLNLDDISYPMLADKEEVPKAAPPAKLDVSEQLEDLYTEILNTAESLYEIENILYRTEVDIAYQDSILKEHVDDVIVHIKKNLESNREGMENDKSILNDRKLELLKQLQQLLGKHPNFAEAQYLKRSDLVNVEKATVEISRKRRKLGEEAKKTEEVKPEPKLEQTPSGDTMPQKKPIKKPVPKPPVTIRTPVRPPQINRATKPICSETDTDLGLNGLENIKNTCYMNTIIQCLRHIPALKNFFTSGEYKKHVTTNDPQIISMFADLVKRLWTGCYVVIRPMEFYNRMCEFHPGYRDGKHEDANEFYMFVFNHLTEDTTIDLSEDKCWAQQQTAFYESLMYKRSAFSEQFYYQVQTDCFCPKCNQHIVKYDTDNLVMLPLPRYGSADAQQLFDDYISKCDMNNLFCKNCEVVSHVNRKLTLLPRVLAIMFKRYYMDQYGAPQKINIPVTFPINNLRLGKATYQLWAACLHNGSARSGHYTALCRNWITREWFEYSDGEIFSIDLTRFSKMDTTAYMLFYQIKDEKMVGFRPDGMLI